MTKHELIEAMRGLDVSRSELTHARSWRAIDAAVGHARGARRTQAVVVTIGLVVATVAAAAAVRTVRSQPEVAAVPVVSAPAVVEEPAAVVSQVASVEARPAARPAEPARLAESADELYARAERELRAHHDDRASALLERLTREFPGHALAEAASFDLALIDARAGRHDEALARARVLASGGRDPNLRAAAAALADTLVR